MTIIRTSYEVGQMIATGNATPAALGRAGYRLEYELADTDAVTLPIDGSAITFISGTFPAGEVYVWVDGHFTTETATSVVRQQVGSSLVTNALGSKEKTKTTRYASTGIVFGAGESNIQTVPVQYLLAAPTTIYAIGRSDHSAGAQTIYGKIIGVYPR